MGLFASALQSAMAEMRWSQTDLVRTTKAVTQSRLSDYLRTSDLPKPEVLEGICRHLPARVREDLISAYLTDQIPPSGADSIQVLAVKEGYRQERRYRPGRAPEGSILRRDLDFLERRALDDPNLAKALNYLATSLQGVPPAADYYSEDLGGFTVEEQARIDAAKRELKAEEQAPPRAHKPVRYSRKKDAGGK